MNYQTLIVAFSYHASSKVTFNVETSSQDFIYFKIDAPESSNQSTSGTMTEIQKLGSLPSQAASSFPETVTTVPNPFFHRPAPPE